MDDRRTEMIIGQDQINVVMQPNLDVLDEVVIVGYGEQKRETVVASVAEVSGNIEGEAHKAIFQL